jgi:2-keto-4-pentenoate hydratase/2-oxohepta-3-ene-1,7-dioic acid hydratase in catechol pathway
VRLVSYEVGGSTGVAVRVGSELRPTGYGSIVELLAEGEAGLERARRAQESDDRVEGARLLAPIPRPAKLLFAGVNYYSHVEEVAGAMVPAEPFFFAKLPSSVIASGEAIVVPAESSVDYEGELAVVIGRRTRTVARSAALDHVLGYTIVNDVSARDVQFGRDQLTLGKGFDTFCPMGPEIVLTDEIRDPSALTLTTHVNDEVRQSASTSDLIFDVAQLLEHASAGITLEPGDVISTGTPAGVGYFRNPRLVLVPGDVIRVEIDGIGELINPVVADG